MASESSFPWCSLTQHGLFYEADTACLTGIYHAHPQWLIGVVTGNDSNARFSITNVFATEEPCDATSIDLTMPYFLNVKDGVID